jgi:hypothetical protein
MISMTTHWRSSHWVTLAEQQLAAVRFATAELTS